METTQKSPINDTFVSRMIGTIHVPESNSLNQDTRPEQLEVCVELASLTLYAAKTLENNLELIKNISWKFSASSLGSDEQCHSQLTWVCEGTSCEKSKNNCFEILLFRLIFIEICHCKAKSV